MGIPPPVLMQAPELFFVRIGVAMLISCLVCLWLAWYITRPLTRLGDATRRITTGDLSARVEGVPKGRNDEIADLGKDFNQMAEQLQALIAAQKRLLNDVSHELRSPLARLQLAVELVRRESDGKVGHMLDRVERESERLDQLVGQLLTLSRLEAGVTDPLNEEIDLTELLREIIRDAEFEARASGRQVTLVAKTEARVRSNRELLRRALENVIRNGVNYTADNSTVVVMLHETDANDAGVVVEVHDSGPGMPEEHLTQVFDPFFRLPEEAGQRKAGYGLGLAIARRVIHAHGGRIAAQNRPEGGLCVSAWLPVLTNDRPKS